MKLKVQDTAAVVEWKLQDNSEAMEWKVHNKSEVMECISTRQEWSYVLVQDNREVIN